MTSIRSNVGEMRRLVEIQSRTMSRDGYGAATATWATEDTVAAKVEPLSGREAWQAQQVRPDVTHQVTIRFWEGLTPKHRFRFGTRVLNIASVIDLEERGRFQVCVCVEEVS